MRKEPDDLPVTDEEEEAWVGLSNLVDLPFGWSETEEELE